MTRRPVIDRLLTMEGWEERESLYHVKRSKIDARRAKGRTGRLGPDTGRICETGKVEDARQDEEAPAAGEDEDDTSAA